MRRWIAFIRLFNPLANVRGFALLANIDPRKLESICIQRDRTWLKWWRHDPTRGRDYIWMNGHGQWHAHCVGSGGDTPTSATLTASARGLRHRQDMAQSVRRHLDQLGAGEHHRFGRKRILASQCECFRLMIWRHQGNSTMAMRAMSPLLPIAAHHSSTTSQVLPGRWPGFPVRTAWNFVISALVQTRAHPIKPIPGMPVVRFPCVTAFILQISRCWATILRLPFLTSNDGHGGNLISEQETTSQFIAASHST